MLESTIEPFDKIMVTQGEGMWVATYIVKVGEFETETRESKLPQDD